VGRFWSRDRQSRRSAINPIEHITTGTRLGRYEIVHRIAFGGMAEIYLARASGIQGFEKYVVLKRILPQYAENGEFVRMFLKEARLAATLDHPNIANVYDIGETAGSYFFTMEYLHGEDLRRIMRHLAERNEKLPLENALAVASGAAAGLHFAHEKKGNDGRHLGIVHRDISPSNVVVTYGGGVKVVDFGVAKVAADPEMSRGYSIKGKLAYMSPEQLASGPVDRRSDVFSLGIMLYEITTDGRLFRGANDVETIRLVLDGQVPLPTTRVPDYPRDLERIVMRALEKDPDRRYASARDLQLDLEAFAGDHRLRMSSAALAEWMESTFGPKREIWHDLPMAALPPLIGATGSLASLRTTEHTAETRVVSVSVEVGPRWPARSSEAADGDGDRAGDVIRLPVALAPAAARARRSRLLTGWAIGLGAATALAAATPMWLARGRPHANASVAAGASAVAPAVTLVAEGGTVTMEDGAPVPPRSATPPAAPQAPVPAAPGALPRAGRPSRRSAPATESFSASFARREGEIRRCFSRHASPASGTEEISLRFQVATDGRVVSAAVLPAAVAATPLGVCLGEIASEARFAPQRAPVTFRIPLTVELKVVERTLR
jgi:serine/threonine protein kinase